MLRVGFIGCGGIAHAHVPGWKATAEGGVAQVVALCDVSDDNITKLETALGLSGAPRYDDWRRMLANEQLDAVDICLPHHLHAPAILAAAEAKVHVLCEKPLCMNFDEAEQITAAIERSGITLMCAHNQLFFPAIRHMRERIDEGLIGEVQMVISADCFRLNRTREEWGWRGPLATAGGGVLIDTGYHPSYRLLHMANSAPASVTAVTQRFHCEIEGEDVANVLVSFESGAIGQVWTSWCFPLPPGTWQVAVYGSEGAVFGRGGEFLHQPYGGEARGETFPGSGGFAEEVQHFAECLRTGATPIQTHVDGINVLKLILGAYEAVRTGRTVRF